MSNYEVPALSIVFMAVSAVLSVVIPVALLIYFYKKHKAPMASFFVGCGVMLVFALILESLVHQAVFSTKAGETILNTTWMYALYGGLMAGLFEETGRFAAFKTILRKYRDKDSTALMYGAGHGGFEAIVLLGVTMIGNIALAVFINVGTLEPIQDLLPAEAAGEFDQLISTLTGTAPYMYLTGIVERLFAIAMQISFSVIVWFAAKDNGSFALYPLAILLHAVVDGITVVASKSGINMWAVEAIIGLMAVIVVILAKVVWRKHTSDTGVE